MKLHDITVKNDEYYTPAYAVKPILEFVPTGSKVWCPFDTEDSLFVKLLTKHGCDVIHTHIWNGVDFFTDDGPEAEFIISNPPYSLKNEVFERLFAMGHPFAMLVGVVGIFESQRRFDMFKNNSFEIMYLNRRVSFFKDYADQKPSLNPPFSSAYVTHEMLPEQIMFRDIDKTQRKLTGNGF